MQPKDKSKPEALSGAAGALEGSYQGPGGKTKPLNREEGSQKGWDQSFEGQETCP